MFVPSPFQPSNATHRFVYDEEGRMRSFRVGPDGAHTQEGGVGESNSLFATDAEYFGTITPFLKVNRIKDARRRNYIIQPGGACIYFDGEKVLKDPYNNGKVQYTAPSDQESFGHNSMDGNKLAQGVDGGRAFTVGRPGNGT